MSEYERSMRVAAPADEVFDRAGDVGRIQSWLPGELHVRAAGAQTVTVHDDDTGRDTDARLRTDRAGKRLEWGADGEHYAGWLQVSSAGERDSEVTIHLSFHDESTAPSRTAVDQALEESLNRLSALVGV